MEAQEAYCENFSSIYFDLNKHLIDNGKEIKSRYGDTKEILTFVTRIEQPILRCTGGYKRDINIFFLLAEALWIWCGRKDVKFLEFFNPRMKEFSDDGKVFHAPYGFRLRNYGAASDGNFIDSEIDQLKKIIELLGKNPNDRQAVASIWNPKMDLGQTSLDKPCNDFIMYKIRENKLHLTVCNRSNDLHWGLPTNVFQFSFITEIMARILDVEVGHQTHVSDSLHIYTNNDNNKIHESMLTNEALDNELYGTITGLGKPALKEMDFIFNDPESCDVKLRNVDFYLNLIVDSIQQLMDSRNTEDDLFNEAIDLWSGVNRIGCISDYFSTIHKLLIFFVIYKKSYIKGTDVYNDNLRCITFARIEDLELSIDVKTLALNWFAARIKHPKFKEMETWKNANNENLGNY